ncbi:MAG: pyridoxal phosphate-dependent aminotransferase [Brevinema sp.]
MQISNITQNLAFSTIRAITETAKEIENSILLTIGEPDITPPQGLINATMDYGRNNPLPYAPSGGSIKLRTLIAEYYNKQFGGNYTLDNVVATVGASEALSSIFKTILNPGDEVLMPAPFFPGYPPYIELSYGKVVIPQADPDNNFAITPELLKPFITPKTKALLFSNPCNPTGTVMTKEQIRSLALFCVEHNITLIADEIYGAVNFEGFSSFASVPEIQDNLIIVNGFSKSHAMTGWRLGYIIVPEKFRQSFLNVHLYTVTCPTNLSIIMGEIALADFADSSDIATLYKERALYLTDAMRELGFVIPQPKGAFYIFANYQNLSKENALDFCMNVLKNTGVAFVPGTAFGMDGWIRAAVTQDLPTLKDVAQRLQKYFKG